MPPVGPEPPALTPSRNELGRCADQGPPLAADGGTLRGRV
jgi:hypothetical protein